MWKKFKSLLAPDPRAIIQNLYASLIWVVSGGMFGGVFLWASNADPLNLNVIKSTFYSISLYVVMALGFGVIAYFIVRLMYKICPPLVMKFSMNLDKQMKNKDFSGLGLLFLKKIKSAPPFLGVQYRNPVIPQFHESRLTEFFLANEFIAMNKQNIRGSGGYYVMRGGDTFQSISKNFYGDEKFSKDIQTLNGLHTPISGGSVKIPRLDVSGNLTSGEVELKYHIAQGDWINSTYNELQGKYNLIRDETLPLLHLIWNTAKMTKKIKQQKTPPKERP